MDSLGGFPVPLSVHPITQSSQYSVIGNLATRGRGRVRGARTARPRGSSSPRTARSDPAPAAPGDDRATGFHRTQAPREHTTLTMPVSSSRFKNTAPWALSGCWRWVTTPPTSDPVPGRPRPQGGGREHPASAQPAAGQLHGRRVRRHPERPQVVGHLLPPGGAGSGGGSDPVTTPGAGPRWPGRRRPRPTPGTVGSAPAGRPGLRGRRVPRPSDETVEGPGRGQGLQLDPGDTGPAHQVLHARPRAPLGDPRRRLLPDAAHRCQPQPHGRPAAPARSVLPAGLGPGPTSSSPASARPAFTSGRRTTTPWRLASATRLWGDQNPMGWAFNSPAVKAAG